jgi:tRNA(Arg) A34 adenosine deaminase TadA
MIGPCAKQVVTATIVTPDGRRFIGRNDVANPQDACPRAGMAAGVGYHLCRDICRQGGHAEIQALRRAGDDARGATLYLEGHSYACDDCTAACAAAGIARIVIGSAP